MRPGVIVDAGPLVAVLRRDDRYHEWVSATFESLKRPLITCESVITEAAHLISRGRGTAEGLLEMIKRGAIETPFCLQREAVSVQRLMQKYAAVPMSLADACIVRLTELHASSLVFTLDSDFNIYRRNGRQTIPLISPRLN